MVVVLTLEWFWDSEVASDTILRLLALLLASPALVIGPLPPALPFMSVSELL